MMKWYRFLLFRGYRLEPDPLTSCNDEFTIGALLTAGSLTDAPSIIIKGSRIIIRGWPMFTMAERMFQEVIDSDTYFRFYLDEHPDYMTRGAWYSPFQWVHLPRERASYGRTYLFPKVLKGRLLIIETKRHLLFFTKDRKTISEIYEQLIEWTARQKEEKALKAAQADLLKLSEAVF